MSDSTEIQNKNFLDLESKINEMVGRINSQEQKIKDLCDALALIGGSVTVSIIASTVQAQSEGQLYSVINEVNSVLSANDVVTLPSAIADKRCFVINNGGNDLQVFPFLSDDLGLGTDVSMTIADGDRALFIAYNSTSWVVITF